MCIRDSASVDRTLFPLETMQIPLSSFTGVNLSDVRFVQLEFTAAAPDRIFFDTISIIRR